jgi:hypothetical protein
MTSLNTLLSAATLLDAMEGVCYLVDREARIVACGTRNWDDFARANGAAQLSASAVTGRPLFSFMQGEEVRQAYTLFNDLLLSDGDAPISFSYRCDAPEIRRELRMSLAPVRHDETVVGVLYQSLVISEVDRPRMNLFDAAHIAELTKIPEGAIIIKICSYCHAVQADAAWITPEAYYRAGGAEDVYVTHGICPDCHGRLVAPRLPKAA